MSADCIPFGVSKLLGSQCNDIDIALENMMGVTFAERFVDYCRTTKDLAVKSVAKIESNPDQSKHLETARTTVMGIELDFVNLRSEEYAENSRIPTQVVSHPLVHPRIYDVNLCLARPSARLSKTPSDETSPSTRYSITYTQESTLR